MLYTGSEDGDEDGYDMIPELSSENDSDDDEMPVSPVKKVKNKQPQGEKRKREKKNKDAASGDRFKMTKSYDGKLKKSRDKRDPEKKKRRSKHGSVAQREIDFLSKANGMNVSTAVVRRLIVSSIEDCIPVIKEENKRIIQRLEARGKPVPGHLYASDSWRLPQEAIQLIRGVLQSELDRSAELATKLKEHAKKKTVTADDLELARWIMDQYRQ